MQLNLLTTSGLQIYEKRYTVHDNVAYISLTKLLCFMQEMRFQNNFNVM